MNVCNRCAELLTDANWYPSYKKKGWHICRECDKARQREHTKNNPEKYKKRHLHKYGISVSDYEVMFEKQKGVCAICEQTCIRESLCVDHDHKTGKVRGLLCIKCNAGLGHFNDNTDLLEKAKIYLWT